jgi:hypothetical protein
MMAVMRGKRQNNHSIVPADIVSIAINATMLIREDDESPMPFSPKPE